jgi:hypothetical protein
LATLLAVFVVAAVSAQRGDQVRLTAFAQAPASAKAPADKPAARKPDTTKLPPVSMTCPMHPDVLEKQPGSCPICKMSLVPVRLATSWMCPIHTTIMSDKPGTCRICGQPLVEARVAVTWTCAAQPGIDRIEPGTCPDGTPTIERRTLRPHSNHNPQHGGQFFMAADNWHHVEGAYPRAGVFRLYIYDDYARPLSAGDLKKVAARVVTNERYDARTRTSTDVTAFTLRPSRDAAYLEAGVTGVAFPAALTAKVKLKPDSPEYRFDFTFAAATKDPVVRVRATQPAAARTKAPAKTSTALAGPVATPIPDTIPEILALIKTRDGEIRDLIRQGNFAAVWVPAFQAKDLAVALEPHIGSLQPASRDAAEPALQRLVRYAWLLDSFGDLGNRQQIEEAYAAFARAATDVSTAFGGAP